MPTPIVLYSLSAKRDAATMTQRDLSQTSGVTERTIQRAERLDPMRGGTALALANALNCEVKDLTRQTEAARQKNVERQKK